MSKSLGNTVSPGDMIERYGADTVRLFILFGANPEAGMEWSDAAIESNHRHILSIIDAFTSISSMNDDHNRIDEWLIARGRANLARWVDCMQKVSLREGVMISHFEMLSDWQWYVRRGGRNRDSGIEYLSNWAHMIAPATPHIAEEIWAGIGDGSILAKSTLVQDHPHEKDSVILAEEAYLRSVIDTARSLLPLAQKHSEKLIDRIVIQTAPEWTVNLAKEAIKLKDSNFDFIRQGMSFIKNHQTFVDSIDKGAVIQIWSSITTGSKKRRGKIQTWTSQETALITNGASEGAILESRSQFIAATLGIENIEVYEAGTGEDAGGKAKFAQPLEPGIAFL